MTDPIGHLTTETAYSGGAAYTTQQTGSTSSASPSARPSPSRPPPRAALLGTSYTFTHVYTATTGLPLKDTYPAAGGLPAETVSSRLLPPRSTCPTSARRRRRLRPGHHLRRLRPASDQETDRAPRQPRRHHQHLRPAHREPDRPAGHPARRPPRPTVDDEAYTYDPAGNITSQTDTRLGSTASAETQCYGYDPLDRLDRRLDRHRQLRRHPDRRQPLHGRRQPRHLQRLLDHLGLRPARRPHQPDRARHDHRRHRHHHQLRLRRQRRRPAAHPRPPRPPPAASPATTSYGYDAAGNMTTRTRPAKGNQTLTWNDAGQLTAHHRQHRRDQPAYIYDADGNLLLQKDPGTHHPVPARRAAHLHTAAPDDHRHPVLSTLPGGGTAYRTGTGNAYGFEIPDQQGTNLLTLDYTAQVPDLAAVHPLRRPPRHHRHLDRQPRLPRQARRPRHRPDHRRRPLVRPRHRPVHQPRPGPGAADAR